MRPGRIVHVNSTIAASDVNTYRIDIPRRRAVVDTVRQNLAGPNWNGGAILTDKRYDPVPGNGRVSRISIRNASAAANNLLVSFDGGNNFFTIPQGESFTWEISNTHFFIKGEALHTGITMQCVATVN